MTALLCFIWSLTLCNSAQPSSNFPMEHCFSTGTICPILQGHLAISADLLDWDGVRWYVERLATWHLVVEARDADKHPTMHRTAPTMKNHLAKTPGAPRSINPFLEMYSARLCPTVFLKTRFYWNAAVPYPLCCLCVAKARLRGCVRDCVVHRA